MYRGRSALPTIQEARGLLVSGMVTSMTQDVLPFDPPFPNLKSFLKLHTWDELSKFSSQKNSIFNITLINHKIQVSEKPETRFLYIIK